MLKYAKLTMIYKPFHNLSYRPIRLVIPAKAGIQQFIEAFGFPLARE